MREGERRTRGDKGCEGKEEEVLIRTRGDDRRESGVRWEGRRGERERKGQRKIKGVR